MRRNLNASMQPGINLSNTARMGVGPYREEHLNGRDYIVVPMTLVVPGVLDGSNGPLLYEEEELAKDPDIWNGIPLIAYHPEVTNNEGESQAVSARDPEVLKKSQVGYNYRTQYTDNALRSEGWFDKELTANYDATLPEQSRMLPRLLNGQPIELSTGLFAENIPHNGNYNGTPYTYIARNYKADHIAILPDQKGACSIKDGCGTSITTEEVQNCRFNYRGLCINCGMSRALANCGGKGGKPGPCPKGTDSKSGGGKSSSKTPTKSKTAQKPTPPTKQKAFRNPAEANKASDAAHKASSAANIREPFVQPGKVGAIGVVPHEEQVGQYIKKQQDARDAHEKAEKEHRKLASIRGPTSTRHASIADHHKAMAEHYKKRLKPNRNRRNTTNRNAPMKEQLTRWLITNCDCWKNKENILNTLTEEELKELKGQFVSRRIVNAAAAKFKGAFTTNAEGEGEVAGIDYGTLAEVFQIDVDITKDPVGFIKALKGKLQEVMDSLDHNEPEPAPTEPVAAMNDDDTPALNAMDDVGPAKDPTMTSNKNGKGKMTPAQFKEMMPEEYRDAWNDFVSNSRNERVTLLNHITNGATPAEKKELLEAYKNMLLPKLRIVAKRMGVTTPTNNKSGYLPEDNLPTFNVGSGYNPNNNGGGQFNEDDIFEVPVENFSRKDRFKPQKPNHLTDDDGDGDE